MDKQTGNPDNTNGERGKDRTHHQAATFIRVTATNAPTDAIGRWEDGFAAIRILVQVKAGIAKRTLASALFEVLAGLRAHRFLVLADEGVLIVLRLDPELGRDHEIRGNAALRTGADRPVVELLRHAPLADAVQAEDMSTFFQYAESPGRGGILFHDRVHADAAVFVHTPLDREREFHLLLVLPQTLL